MIKRITIRQLSLILPGIGSILYVLSCSLPSDVRPFNGRISAEPVSNSEILVTWWVDDDTVRLRWREDGQGKLGEEGEEFIKDRSFHSVRNLDSGQSYVFEVWGTVSDSADPQGSQAQTVATTFKKLEILTLQDSLRDATAGGEYEARIAASSGSRPRFKLTWHLDSRGTPEVNWRLRQIEKDSILVVRANLPAQPAASYSWTVKVEGLGQGPVEKTYTLKVNPPEESGAGESGLP